MAPAVAYSQSYATDQSLHSAALELKYERSAHLVDIIVKDESVRKLRFDIHVLEDDNDDLRDLLAKEEDRSDALEKLVNEHLLRAEDAEADVHHLQSELQLREQDLASLRAEVKALHKISTDANKALTEKLESTRELSQLKPELQHLRSQVTANQEVLAEKLSLQRQLSTLQVDLEQSKREAQRALAKRRNTMHDMAQEDEIETLRKAATREKRLRERAESALEQLQTELDNEQKAAQRTAAKETKQVEQDAQAEVRSEELSRELAREQKERAKAERALQVAQGDWEAQKSILDDKLNQFRSKLKSTKERLKETETALATAQTATAAAAPKQASKTTTTKASKKRNAAAMDPDATTLGTPGDGAPAKRGRKAAAVGEKSSFSITPFLNRTMSVVPSSPDDRDAADESAAEASPTAAAAVTKVPTKGPATSTTKKQQPLAPVSASKSNVIKKAAPRKKVVLSVLEKVTEEDEQSSQRPADKSSEPLTVAAQPALKPKPKMRKSLAAFASFNVEADVEKKKKRKLGGLGKTLFDEDDDAPKALPGRGLFGGMRMGPLGGLGKGASFLGGAGAAAGRAGRTSGLMATDDGFQFSPLKKDRRMMSFVK